MRIHVIEPCSISSIESPGRRRSGSSRSETADQIAAASADLHQHSCSTSGSPGLRVKGVLHGQSQNEPYTAESATAPFSRRRRATTGTAAARSSPRTRPCCTRLQYAYRDRRARKGDFRRLWIQRINAAARENGTSYSRFVSGPEAERGRGRPQGPRRPCRHGPRGVQSPGSSQSADTSATAVIPAKTDSTERAPIGRRTQPEWTAGASPDRSGSACGTKRVQRLRRLLQRRSARLADGVFVAEGVKLLDCALDAACSRSNPSTSRADALDSPESASRSSGPSLPAPAAFELGPGVSSRGSLVTVTPQPVLAVVRTPEATLEDRIGRGSRGRLRGRERPR